ncbi:unnamed protein product [Meloidogyne enterolobii]|uniref:Uncharacterized protein n=1 Tax=Meloidogyne enterolobii TaxID=390850 RepID=A0ACB0ZIT6_MELEN
MYKNAEDLIQNKTISNGKVSEGKYKKDELIDAVFQQVNLPEVHFIQSSPPVSSPKITCVPPNSVRSEIGEINIFEEENVDLITPRKSPNTPERQSALSQCEEDYNDDDEYIDKEGDENENKQKKLNEEIKIDSTKTMLAAEEKIKNDEIEIQQVEITLTESSSPEIVKKEEKKAKEDEEEPSINLFSHKNSLEYGNIKRSTNIQGGNDEEIEEIEPLTPTTGEGCLDSVRSIIATNGETPTKILENSEDDWSEQNNNLIDDNECRRVSSTISRELVNSVIELAIQNTEEFDDEDNKSNNNEIENTKIKEKKKDDFQLELNKKVLQKQQNYEEIGINNYLNNSSNNNSISGQSSPNSNFRDIHVRTSLNDPSSPFKQLAYTAFEPEKQEIIRKEIGSFGPEGIKKIVDKFQNVAKLNKKEEEEIIAEIKNKKLKNKVFARQKSAHFYIEKEQVPKQQEDQPKRKSTPHPVQRQSSLQQQQPEDENTKNNFALSRSEIVIESQRPVADILNQFQSCHYSHAANIKKALNEENDDFYIRKVRPKSFGSSDMQRNFGKNTSVWANNNKNNSQQTPPITCFTKEPTPGSLAAIRLSLSSSIPSTPSVSPILLDNNNSPPNETEKVGNKQKENNNLLHGKDGILPKNVGHFYRIWGSAQAQSATKTTEKQSKIIENVNNLATNEE